MLYIESEPSGHSGSWHVGGGVFIPMKIASLRADGHELAYIENMLPHMPIPNRRVVKWEGKIAQWIYDQLVQYQKGESK